MGEETSQDENIKNSELTIAKLQQKVLGRGSRCPVLLRLGRMEFLLVSSLLIYIWSRSPSGAHRGGEVQAVFKKRYFLKEKNTLKREFHQTSWAVGFLCPSFYMICPYRPIYVFCTMITTVSYNY